MFPIHYEKSIAFAFVLYCDAKHLDILRKSSYVYCYLFFLLPHSLLNSYISICPAIPFFVFKVFLPSVSTFHLLQYLILQNASFHYMLIYFLNLFPPLSFCLSVFFFFSSFNLGFISLPFM